MKKKRNIIDAEIFCRIFSKRIFAVLLAAIMLTLVFSVSVYAWGKTFVIGNSKNSISTGETLVSIELSKDGAVVYSSSDINRIEENVSIDGQEGDACTLKITNSGNIDLRYLVSASVNGKELLSVEESASNDGINGILLELDETQTYSFTLDKDVSEIFLRLNTSFESASVQELEKLAEAEESTEDASSAEEASSEITEENTTESAEQQESSEPSQQTTAAPAEPATEPSTVPESTSAKPTEPTENEEDNTEAAATDPTEPTEATAEPTTEQPTEIISSEVPDTGEISEESITAPAEGEAAASEEQPEAVIAAIDEACTDVSEVHV